MNISLAKPIVSASHRLLAFRRWFENYRAYRFSRREAIDLSRLPVHLLRDIGCEDLITYSVNQGRAEGRDPFARQNFI